VGEKAIYGIKQGELLEKREKEENLWKVEVELTKYKMDKKRLKSARG
jgi:hypothetical protein